jgi:hypothetical protein
MFAFPDEVAQPAGQQLTDGRLFLCAQTVACDQAINRIGSPEHLKFPGGICPKVLSGAGEQHRAMPVMAAAWASESGARESIAQHLFADNLCSRDRVRTVRSPVEYGVLRLNVQPPDPNTSLLK